MNVGPYANSFTQTNVTCIKFIKNVKVFLTRDVWNNFSRTFSKIGKTIGPFAKKIISKSLKLGRTRKHSFQGFDSRKYSYFLNLCLTLKYRLTYLSNLTYLDSCKKKRS